MDWRRWGFAFTGSLSLRHSCSSFEGRSVGAFIIRPIIKGTCSLVVPWNDTQRLPDSHESPIRERSNAQQGLNTWFSPYYWEVSYNPRVIRHFLINRTGVCVRPLLSSLDILKRVCFLCVAAASPIIRQRVCLFIQCMMVVNVACEFAS